MGQNIILNMNDHGFVVAAYNRTVSKVDEFLAHEAKGTNIIGARSLEEIRKVDASLSAQVSHMVDLSADSVMAAAEDLLEETKRSA